MSSPSPLESAEQDAANLAAIAARAADDKLAANTLVIDVAEVLAITDYFVVTAGANPRQVRALSLIHISEPTRPY